MNVNLKKCQYFTGFCTNLLFLETHKLLIKLPCLLDLTHRHASQSLGPFLSIPNKKDNKSIHVDNINNEKGEPLSAYQKAGRDIFQSFVYPREAPR